MVKKRHHYVPRHYLKGFAIPRQFKNIWVYPKDGGEPFKTNIINTGVENYFYSTLKEDGSKDNETIENFLEREIEAPATPIIDKLRYRKPITRNEKRILAVYLVGMLTRVPKNKERVQKDIPKHIEEARQTTWKILQDGIKKNPDDKERLQNLIEETGKAFQEMEKSLIEELSLPHFEELLITILDLMNWGLWTSSSKSSFITSDNPFCFAEHEGLLSKDGRFIFPVSSKIVLIGSNDAPENIKDFAINYVQMDKETSNAINRIIIGSSSKYIYHNARVDWVSDLIQQVIQGNG